MATKTANPNSRESSGRSLKHRSMPFVGLLLAPPGAYVAGLTVHYVNVDAPIAIGLYAALLASLSTGLAILAYLLGRKRDPVVAWHVVVTVVMTGLGLAVTIVVGAERWWSTTFMILGEILAASWGLHRIDALRKDQKGEQEPQEDELTKKLGLQNTGFGKVKKFTDENGDVTRIEVPVKHGPGETAEVIQGAVGGIESVADQAMGGGVPRGRSRAVPTDGAGSSTLVIITKDVLKGLVVYPGPSSPGGCITEPLHGGVYEDQQIVVRYVAGGSELAPNPASTGWMGMTRTGKTMDAQTDGLEIISRRNVQMMWFDTIKGAQTVRPMRRGLDVIVASDDPKQFKAGMKALQDLIKWRATELGKYGYRSWTPEAAADPRLKMPFLIPHFEEADALCEIAPDEMVWIASKGLSAGVAMQISLQRADGNSMPTGLRFNVGNWKCFGCGDDYSAGFALTSATIDAGAHPENWKQSKPGYHYAEGMGIDAQRGPVPAKAYFATDQQLEAHCEVWGPRMQPLDAGSIAALGDWYVKAKQSTRELVAEWDAGPDAQPVVHDGVATTPARPVTSANDDDFDETMRAVAEEIDEIGDELHRDGTYDDVDPETHRIDPGQPTPPVGPGQEVSWRSSKEAAPDADAALDALRAALLEVLTGTSTDDDEEDEEWVHRQPDGSVVFMVGALSRRYRFRSQPWFSPKLRDVASGQIHLPGLTLETLDSPGQYRLQAVDEPVGVGNGA